MTTLPGNGPHVRSVSSAHTATPKGTLQSPYRQHPPRLFPTQALEDNPLPSPSTASRDASEPPFKKPRLQDNVKRVDTGAAKAALEPTNQITKVKEGHESQSSDAPTSNPSHSQLKPTRQPSFFPHRPSSKSHSNAAPTSSALAIERATKKGIVQVKSYVPETPAVAPPFENGGLADFCPWTGNHPEDVLNEVATRNGFYDKVQNTQSESSTVRPTLWTSLKHKSGLQVLSSLLVSALDQRQIHGTITATSTFKPPPRVTLTDTKREAWLRDLSNPSIPLRRLSRTIPHGIRGKILLDHCLSKRIPISRAIWLAKCVGANEIRAFKRKGAGGIFTVGGETKWIKEWTCNVEQFLESVIGTCGSKDWKTHIDYGLRLSSYLFTEHLLDRDHYLDWLITSTVEVDLDSLPIWLLLLNIHLQDLMSSRQRGRRITESLLEHLYQAHHPIRRDIYKAVLQQIVDILRSVMASTPLCFLLPRCWNKYEDVMRACVVNDEPTFKMLFFEIAHRNITLQDRAFHKAGQLQETPRRKVIALFDGLSGESSFGSAAKACLKAAHDHDMLVTSCLKWSCSIHRHGRFRVYAAARLMRYWSRHAIDLQRPILEFLVANPEASELHKPDIYRLLAELVCSDHFSVGKYLQWLMARGTLNGREKPNCDGLCEIRLLFELPLHGLPAHVLNLRRSLLSTLRTSDDDEDTSLEEAKYMIRKHVYSQHDPTVAPSGEVGGLSLLSRTAKSGLARWMRQSVMMSLEHRKTSQPPAEPDHQGKGGIREDSLETISLKQFLEIRGILEDMDEFPVLADILRIVSEKSEGSLLVHLADTVNFHSDVFGAIGASHDLFRSMYDRVQELHDEELLEKPFLESLIDVGNRLSNTMQEVHKLRKCLSLLGPKLLGAACSPISDTMVEAVQPTEPTFVDEMDQMLASGTSMDKQTLTRVFGTLSDHLEKSWTDTSSLIRSSDLLARLRVFDTKSFDLLATDWLEHMLSLHDQPKLSRILPPILCSKVVSVSLVFEHVLANTTLRDDNDQNNLRVLDALALMTDKSAKRMPNADYRYYRLLDQQRRLIQNHPEWIVRSIQFAIEAPHAESKFAQQRVQDFLGSKPVDLLLRIALHQASINGNLEGLLDAGARKTVGYILTTADSGDASALAMHEQVSNLLDHVSDFNVYLCYLKLQALLTMASSTPESSLNMVADQLVEKTTRSSKDQVLLWSRLIPELSTDYTVPICKTAQNRLLSTFIGQSSQHSKHMEDLLSIIEATAAGTPEAEALSMLEHISTISSSLTASLSSCRDAPSLDDNSQSELLDRTNILLRLLVIHQSTSNSQKDPPNVLSQVALSLSILLIHPSFATHTKLTTHILDVLAYLSDSLTEDARSRCAQTLRDVYRTRDPRLRFIFGYSKNAGGEWLQLVSNTGSGTTGEATATMQPYPLRRWEMMQDATPVVAENDTSLSLTLFGARKSVL